MAYADRNTSGSRIVAIVLVAVIIAGVGYAFVTGLAYQYIKKKAEEMNVFDVNEPPPPPEEVPPPPPPDTPVPPPPTQVVAPPALVPVPSPIRIETVRTPPPAAPIIPPAPPAPPAPPPPPPPPRKAKEATPRGAPQSWVTNDDYPPAARRAEQQGTTSFRLNIDADGKVSDCTVTNSSGFSQLDNAVCSLMRRRARFRPAEDPSGNKIPDTWSSRFRWELPRR